MNEEIYLDHASTTYTDARVLEAMLPYFSEIYGNPETFHKQGKKSIIAIDDARETIAKILNCRQSEVIFTGSATESNNLAIQGTARAYKIKGMHLITSAMEHSSLLEPFQMLVDEGFSVTYIKPNKEGFIEPKDVEDAIQKDTILVSIMHANNEIGTIQPIAKIGEICKRNNVIFHTDSAQTAASESLDTKILNVDLLTLNAGKIYGPKGIGALFVKQGTRLKPIIVGGSHEFGLRAGTHNVPAIVGMAKALELIQSEKEEENNRLTTLRDLLIDGILDNIPNSHLNGSKTNRLPNNVNISFKGLNATELILHLDEQNIFVNTGAACKKGKEGCSPTLTAIGLCDEDIAATLRLSLGKRNTKQQIEKVIKTLTDIVKNLRK